MFRNYLQIALRSLGKQPGYAFINVFGLAVGMAAFFVIALFIARETSYDTHIEDAERIYRWSTEGSFRTGPVNSAASAPAWGPALRSVAPEVETVARIKPPNQMWLVAKDDLKFLEKGFIFADSTTFDVFGFELIKGTEDALRAPFSLVLSETMAGKYFGTEDPMGQTLRLDNTYDFTVTGVIRDVEHPSHFKADFLASFTTLQAPIYGEGFLESQFFPAVYTYVKLRPGTSADVLRERADAYLDQAIGEQLASLGGEVHALIQPLTSIHLASHLDNEILPGGSQTTVWALSAIALFILLIACINYMNLATARSAQRAREVGIRKTMGAERAQLIRQFLGESLVLSLTSMVWAVGMVWMFLPTFNQAAGTELSLLSGGLLRAALIFVGIALFCGLAAGSYPALFLSRFQPVLVLKGTHGSATSGGGLRRILVVFQFAISIILIVATTVVFRQLNFTRDMDLGFDREQVLVVQLTDPSIRQQYRQFRDRVSLLPSVASVSASSSAPGFLIGTTIAYPEGGSPDDQYFLQSFVSDFDFVETMGLDVVAGRSLSRDRPADSLGVFLINETAARDFGWDEPQQALNRSLTLAVGPDGFTGEIVGVVRDFHAESLHDPIAPTLITVFNDQAFQYAMIRTRPGQTRDAIEQVGRIWNELYPAYIYQFSFLEDDVNALYAADLQLGRLFGGFAFLTILIACLGLFGLASFTAERRVKEIGVRKVMGAGTGEIVLLLARDFTKSVGVAFLIASPLAWIGMNRWLDSFQYRTEFGVLSLLLVGIGVLVVALITVGYQTVRASLSNPVDALKYE
jgi:putative ABC transport system permease protein